MRNELHTQYKLFEREDYISMRIAELKAYFEADLREALQIQ